MQEGVVRQEHVIGEDDSGRMLREERASRQSPRNRFIQSIIFCKSRAWWVERTNQICFT